jgi:hypothetical protein
MAQVVDLPHCREYFRLLCVGFEAEDFPRPRYGIAGVGCFVGRGAFYQCVSGAVFVFNPRHSKKLLLFPEIQRRNTLLAGDLV